MKDETGGKISAKFATPGPKTYDCRVQRDDREIEDNEFVKAKGMKNSASEELTFHDFLKCVYYITNTATTNEQMSFRSYTHKNYTITCNKVSLCHCNENDDEFKMIGEHLIFRRRI